MRTRTARAIRAELDRRGMSIADLAREIGYPAEAVVNVLSGRVRGSRGRAHNIAVALGLKRGEMLPEYPPQTLEQTAHTAAHTAQAGA